MDIQRTKEITGLAPNDTVEIHGLRNSPQYNGQRGEIGKFFEDSGRFEVKLGAPFYKSVKIKVRNLKKTYFFMLDRSDPANVRISQQVLVHQREANMAIAHANTGAQIQAYRKICTLIENNAPEFEELKNEYYWNAKKILLLLELESGRGIEYDEYKNNAFEIINDACDPGLQVSALLLWCDAIKINPEDLVEECEEAMNMLQEKLDTGTYYGQLHQIIRRLESLIIKKDMDFARACFLFEEYIPICESLPVKYDQFTLRLDYAYTFTDWLDLWMNELARDTNETNIEDMMIKGAGIIDGMNDAWHHFTYNDTNGKVESDKLEVEAKFILLRAEVNDPPEVSMVERALRIYEQAAKLRISAKGVGYATNIFDGIAICCMHLGDAKKAKKFWRKVARKSLNCERDFKITKKIKTMQHTRDVSISLGKEVRCHRPECDNIGGSKYCTRCQTVKYCSRKCQKADWKKHKKYCNKNPSPVPFK